MNNKEFLNEEFLKSIDSSYNFNNNPINRYKISFEPKEIKLQLENLKKHISKIMQKIWFLVMEILKVS